MERDPLTGLLTRAEFTRRAETARVGALAHFDVSGLRQLNDCYGHATGDKVLAEFSALFQRECPNALLGRLGGSEFVALFPDVETAVSAAEKVRYTVMCEFFPQQKAAALGVGPDALRAVKVQAGVVDLAVCKSLTDALEEADRALWQVKVLGPGHVAVARPELRFDRVTGLLSRRDFDIALQLALRGYHSFALLYADIDGFKRFNDVCGHEVGDEALRAMGSALSQVSGIESAARYGGDQFAALVMSCAKHDLERVAEQTWSALAGATPTFKRRLQDRLGESSRDGLRRQSLGVSLSALWMPQVARLDFQEVMETAHDLVKQMRHLDSTGYVCLRLPTRDKSS